MVAVPSIGRADQPAPSRSAPQADATRDLYERYSRQIYAYCLHQLRSKEEAEDATQSTFLNAFRGLKRGVDPEFESAWLYKIAQNVCLTRQRSSTRRRRVESPGDLDAMQDFVPAHEVDPDELINLPEALQGMPEQQRRALLLREWQGLSYKEIGNELDLSQAAVETLLFRARRTLAAGLTEEQPRSPAKRLRAGGDLGSALAIAKSLLVTGGAKVAATVATVAATSAVAATPVARHAVVHVVDPAVAKAKPRHVAPAAPRHPARAVPLASAAAALPTQRVHVLVVAHPARHVRFLRHAAPVHHVTRFVAAHPPAVPDEPAATVAPAASPVAPAAAPAVVEPAPKAADPPVLRSPESASPKPKEHGDRDKKNQSDPVPPPTEDVAPVPVDETPAVVAANSRSAYAPGQSKRDGAGKNDRDAKDRDHGKKADPAPAPAPPAAPAPVPAAAPAPAPAAATPVPAPATTTPAPPSADTGNDHGNKPDRRQGDRGSGKKK